MSYSLYIFFGLAPSIIWLLFFLRKDSHPESNRMILKIFFYGMLMAFVAALVEIGFFEFFFETNRINISSLPFFLLYNFVGIAFAEEFLKYSIIRFKVLKHPEFDEPTDAMLYMIIAALGFAALENVLVLLSIGKPFIFTETIAASSLRFLGATFLHALCSGTVGYFLALSLLETKKNIRLIIIGLLTATLLHGLFNFSIIKSVNSPNFLLLTIIILMGLAFFVSFGFKRVKKIKSVCK